MSAKLYLLPQARPDAKTAETVLETALGEKLSTALVLGWDQDGHAVYISSTGDGAELIWLIEKFKHALLSGHCAE
jgi:hypothetical protein